MHSPNKLQKIGSLVIMIGGGISAAIVIFMTVAKVEYLLGIHAEKYLFTMAYIFLVGSGLIAIGTLYKKSSKN